MDATIASELGIPIHTLSVPMDTRTLNGRSLGGVTHCTVPIQIHLPRDVSKALDVSVIPTEYHALLEVFSKARATSRPPHRPYDCAIDLLPGTTPPRGRLYSLSVPETKAMEEHIEESLATGSVSLSASPAG